MVAPVKFVSPRFISASRLVGAKVYNPGDESLGELQDCMIDATSGKIAYGILSFGGVLGMGNKLFAIPWNSFRVEAETERLVLDVAKDRLKHAPGFDEQHWPDFGDPSFAEQTEQGYATGRDTAQTGSEARVIHPE